MILTALIIGSLGCVSEKAVKWPVPVVPDRPPIQFTDAFGPNGHRICTTVPELRKMLLYQDDLELELKKAQATLRQLNEAQ